MESLPEYARVWHAVHLLMEDSVMEESEIAGVPMDLLLGLFQLKK